MGKPICPLEKETIESLKKGVLTQEMKKHLAVCQVCEETLSVYLWMNKFKDIRKRDDIFLKKLPEAESIWRRAYAYRRKEEELIRRALRPIVYSKIASYGVFIVGVIFLLLSYFQEIKNYALTNIGASQLFGPLLKTTVRWLPLFFIPMAIVFFWMLFVAIVTTLEKSRA